jgi:hypothetical protein
MSLGDWAMPLLQPDALHDAAATGTETAQCGETPHAPGCSYAQTRGALPRYRGGMQDLPAVPVPANVGVPHFPGRTPRTAHAARASVVVAAPAPDTAARPAVHTVSPAAPWHQHWALEGLEDAFLLLLIVLAVPAVILLLAAPFALILRVAAMIRG